MSSKTCIQQNHDEIHSPKDNSPSLSRVHMSRLVILYFLRWHMKGTGSFQCI